MYTAAVKEFVRGIGPNTIETLTGERVSKLSLERVDEDKYGGGIHVFSTYNTNIWVPGRLQKTVTLDYWYYLLANFGDDTKRICEEELISLLSQLPYDEVWATIRAGRPGFGHGASIETLIHSRNNLETICLDYDLVKRRKGGADSFRLRPRYTAKNSREIRERLESVKIRRTQKD